MTTLDEAVLQAMKALGGDRHIDEVKGWIYAKYGRQWADVGTAMADLTNPPNSSTQYPPSKHCLERVKPGVYRLREGF
jgi:hypothetical protein